MVQKLSLGRTFVYKVSSALLHIQLACILCMAYRGDGKHSMIVWSIIIVFNNVNE